MKKIALFSVMFVLLTTGCSKTWSGLKQDSSELLLGTKEVIHEATSPTTIQDNTPVVQTATPAVPQNTTKQQLHPAIPTAD